MRRLQMAVAVSAGIPTSQGNQYLDCLHAKVQSSNPKSVASQLQVCSKNSLAVKIVFNQLLMLA